MKTIIAPVDFSDVSYNAGFYAAKMAQDINAELILLHIAELPIAAAEYPVTEEVFNSLQMEKELQELKEKLAAETNGKISIQTKNIIGSIEYEIKELCQEKKPFAVIMATHSYAILDRFFVGSTTLYNVKRLSFPVLVIPPEAKYKAIKKIAIASDLKDIYDVPANEIGTIIKCFNAELEILYAGKNQRPVNRHALASMLLEHRLVNLSPQFFSIEDEDVLRGITALAQKHQVDMLIIIPKKHGPFHKSQSKDFIFYSHVPVMAIHENDLAPQV